MKLNADEFYEVVASLNDHAVQIKEMDIDGGEDSIEFSNKLTKKIHNYIFSNLTDDEFYDGDFEVEIKIKKK